MARFRVAVVTIAVFFCLGTLPAAIGTTYLIDDSNGVGRTFDGIGAISGGGATSKMLINYPEPHRSNVLDYLFKPNFGASLHILKVEIGGDDQSTEGTESSHMHTVDDENYQRGYEWWMMTEAKKRNPSIKLYGLPWTFPAWVGNGTSSPLKHPSVTATYVVNWILGAKKYYNLTMDYIGIWNERLYDKAYIKALRTSLDVHQLQNVKIVASDDFGWLIADEMLLDEELKKLVDIIGSHYPGTEAGPVAQFSGKPLWSSEDYSTFNDNVGAGCLARILNNNYVNGQMTSTIMWNLIASYYDDLPFPRCGLMTANVPWTGHYEVASPIWITAHTTQFTQPGWTYLRHKSGVSKLSGGGSFVALTSPNRDQLTIIIETMSHNHSQCVRPPLLPYSVEPQPVTLQLNGNFKDVSLLYMWYTRLGFEGDSSTLFQQKAPLSVTDGIVKLNLDVDVVITLTTLSTGIHGDHGSPPDTYPFLLPYIDSFESYPEYSDPNNFMQQIGAFEIRAETNNKFIRQVVTEKPISWCPGANDKPMSVIGNYNWSQISIQMDIRWSEANKPSGIFLAQRVDRGGCDSYAAKGYFFFLFPALNEFQLTEDLSRTKILAKGSTPPLLSNQWINMKFLSYNGLQLVGMLNTTLLFNFDVRSGPQNGFNAIGLDSFGLADFDNLLML